MGNNSKNLVVTLSNEFTKGKRKNAFDVIKFIEKVLIYVNKRGSYKGITHDPEIGSQVKAVRATYFGKNKLNLSQEDIDALNGIGFEWKSDWFTPFVKYLKQYKKDHDCSFRGVSQDPKIGGLVKRVRTAYKGNSPYRITQDMIDILHEIDFPFEAEIGLWVDDFVNDVENYKKNNNGSLNGITKDAKLKSKIGNIRRAYAGKGSYVLTPEIIKKIEATGLKISVEKHDWFTPFYDTLLKIKEKDGNFDRLYEHKVLLATVRSVRRAYQGKGSTRLTKEMIDKLNAIGFNWEAEKKEEWFPKFYEKLVAYKEKHGSFDRVRSDPEIGRTVNTVRLAYNGKSEVKLTKKMIDDLNLIGFVWNAKKSKKGEDVLSVM